MEVSEIIDILREAIIKEDWDVVRDLIEKLSYGNDDDFDDFLNNDDDY